MRESAQIISVNKNFKATITRMVIGPKETMLKEVKEAVMTVCHQIENVSKETGGKRWKKPNGSSRDEKCSNWNEKLTEGEKGTEKTFKEIITENFWNLMKSINVHSQGGQRTASRINSEIYTPTHHNKNAERESLASSKRKMTHHVQEYSNKINS